jgi:hypothetical protein
MKMPFGKFRGRPLRDVPDDYLGWLADNVDMKPRLRAAVNRELEVREANTMTKSVGQPPARVDVEGVIRTWYRGLCMTYHPDHGGDHDGLAMRAINDAHNRLKKLLLERTNGHR